MSNLPAKGYRTVGIDTQIPWPDKELFVRESDHFRYGYYIQTARGCPMRCSFCTEDFLSGLSTTGKRNQVIPGQALAMPQLDLVAMAVLAAVVVAREEEGVGDLTAEAAGDVHELDKADDGGPGNDETFTSNDIVSLGLDDLRFAFDDQPKGSPNGHHGEGLERRVQGKTTHRLAPG